MSKFAHYFCLCQKLIIQTYVVQTHAVQTHVEQRGYMYFRLHLFADVSVVRIYPRFRDAKTYIPRNLLENFCFFARAPCLHLYLLCFVIFSVVNPRARSRACLYFFHQFCIFIISWIVCFGIFSPYNRGIYFSLCNTKSSQFVIFIRALHCLHIGNKLHIDKIPPLYSDII